MNVSIMTNNNQGVNKMTRIVKSRSPLYNAKLRAKSKVKSPVKLVWDLCFDHPKAKRRDIVDMAIKKGVAMNTAKSQYQYWRSASKSVRAKHA